MEYLAYIAMLLLLGVLCSALAYRMKVSSVFFLILAGMLLSVFNLVVFEREFIVIVSELALILVLFNSTTKLRITEVKRYSPKALRLAFLFLIFCCLFMGFITYTSLELDSVLLALLFAVLVYGIDPTIALAVLGKKKNRIMEILEIEAIINTPITVIAALPPLT